MKADPSFADAYPQLYEMIAYYNRSHPTCWDDLITNDVTLVNAESGKLVFELLVQETHCNQLGNLHGGCVATLIDVCTSFATLVSEGKTKWKAMGVSTDLAISYYMGIPAGETVRIECIVQRLGKNLANLSATIFNSDGKACYSGSHTKFCIDNRLKL